MRNRKIAKIEDVVIREECFCKHRGELKASSVFGGKVSVRDLAGFERSEYLNKAEVEFVTDYNFDYAIGLIETQGPDGKMQWRGSSDHHLISIEIGKVYEFMQSNSQNHGFTVQYAINTAKKVAVEVMKKGKLTKKLCQMLLDMGFDQFYFSGCWAPSNFYLNGEVVPVAAEFSLVSGSDLDPWAKALYGRSIPSERDRWEVLPVHPEYLERLTSILETK
jgi:hypothetical protein